MSSVLGFLVAREVALRQTQSESEANRLGLLGAVAGPVGAVAAASIGREAPARPAVKDPSPADESMVALREELRKFEEAITESLADANQEATKRVTKKIAEFTKALTKKEQEERRKQEDDQSGPG